MMLKRTALLLFFVSALFLSSCGLKSDIPDLSAEELKKMMDGDTNLVVIDTRTQFEYARGRIPRSLFVPEEKFYALKLILPPVKDTALVFYCRGPG
jgi:rhodanese-related sulfurtransferase